ncbi:MAG: hypothetical protein R3F61_37140 [Myxococcota bacterium]
MPARLGVHVDVDALNAVLPVATLLWNDGQLSLHLDDVLDGLVVPASEDLGAAERVDRRMALAEQLDALPPGDTGLGGVP